MRNHLRYDLYMTKTIKPKKETKAKAPAVLKSPVVKKSEPEALDFLGAMKAILEGKRVRRKEWPANEYACLESSWLKIFRGSYNAWIIGDGDYLSKDWEII